MQKVVMVPITQIDAKLNPLFEDGWEIIPETFRVVPQAVRNGREGQDVKPPSLQFIVAVLSKP